MDHKTLITSLEADTRRALTQKSDRVGLTRLAAHLGCIVALGSYVVFGAPFWGLALIPLGVCIMFLFTLLHETVHFNPFETARLNTLAGHLCSVSVIVPNTWFRYFHLAHHKHTNDQQNDPELGTPKPDTMRDYIWHISGLPYWKSMAVLIWQHARGKVSAPYLPERAHAAVVWQARGMIAFYGCAVLLALLGWSGIFWCWMLPLLLG